MSEIPSIQPQAPQQPQGPPDDRQRFQEEMTRRFVESQRARDMFGPFSEIALHPPRDYTETEQMVRGMVEQAQAESRRISLDHYQRMIAAGQVQAYDAQLSNELWGQDSQVGSDLIESGMQNAGIGGMQNPQTRTAFADMIADLEKRLGQDGGQYPTGKEGPGGTMEFQRPMHQQVRELRSLHGSMSRVGDSLSEDSQQLRALASKLIDKSNANPTWESTKAFIKTAFSSAAGGIVGTRGTRQQQVIEQLANAIKGAAWNRAPEGEAAPAGPGVEWLREHVVNPVEKSLGGIIGEGMPRGSQLPISRKSYERLLFNEIMPEVSKAVGDPTVGEHIANSVAELVGFAGPVASAALKGGAAAGRFVVSELADSAAKMASGTAFQRQLSPIAMRGLQSIAGRVEVAGASAGLGASMALIPPPESEQARWDSLGEQQASDARAAYIASQALNGAILLPAMSILRPIAATSQKLGARIGAVGGAGLGRIGSEIGHGVGVGAAFPIAQEAATHIWEGILHVGQKLEDAGESGPIDDQLRKLARGQMVSGELPAKPVSEMISAAASGDLPGLIRAAKGYMLQVAPGAIGFGTMGLVRAFTGASPTFAELMRGIDSKALYDRLAERAKEEASRAIEGQVEPARVDAVATEMVERMRRNMPDSEPPAARSAMDRYRETNDSADRIVEEDMAVRSITGEKPTDRPTTAARALAAERDRVMDLQPTEPGEEPGRGYGEALGRAQALRDLADSQDASRFTQPEREALARSSAAKEEQRPLAKVQADREETAARALEFEAGGAEADLARVTAIEEAGAARDFGRFAHAVETLEPGDHLRIGLDQPLEVVERRPGGEVVVRQGGIDSVWSSRELFDASSRGKLEVLPKQAMSELVSRETEQKSPASAAPTAADPIPRRRGGVFQAHDPIVVGGLRDAHRMLPEVKAMVDGRDPVDTPVAREVRKEVERLAAENEAFRKLKPRDQMLSAAHGIITRRMGVPRTHWQAPEQLFTDRVRHAVHQWDDAVERRIRAEGSLADLYRWRDIDRELFHGATSVLLELDPNGQKLLRRIDDIQSEMWRQRGEFAFPVADMAASAARFGRRFVRALHGNRIAAALIDQSERLPFVHKPSGLTDRILSLLPDGFRDFLSNPQTYGGALARDAVMAIEMSMADIQQQSDVFFRWDSGLFAGLKERDPIDLEVAKALDSGPDSPDWKFASPRAQNIARQARAWFESVREMVVRADPWVRRANQEIDYYTEQQTRWETQRGDATNRYDQWKAVAAKHPNTARIDAVKKEIARAKRAKEDPSDLRDMLRELRSEREADVDAATGITGRIERSRLSEAGRGVNRSTEGAAHWREVRDDFIQAWGVRDGYLHQMLRMEAADVLAGRRTHASVDWPSEAAAKWIADVKDGREQRSDRRSTRDMIGRNPAEGPLRVLDVVEARRFAVRSAVKRRTGKLEELGLVEPSAMRRIHAYIRDVFPLIRHNELLARYDEFLYGRPKPATWGEMNTAGREVVYRGMRMMSAGVGTPKLRGGKLVGFAFGKNGNVNAMPQAGEAGERSFLLIHASVPKPSPEQMADPRWIEANSGVFQLVKARDVPFEVRTWHNGLVPHANEVGGAVKGRADRLQNYVENQFLGATDRLREGELSGTGLDREVRKAARMMERFTRLLNTHMSAMALGGITNIDNALKAGGGGLLMAYLALGRYGTNVEAWKALGRYERALKKAQTSVAGIAGRVTVADKQQINSPWMSLTRDILDSMKPTEQELARMSDSKRQRVLWGHEAMTAAVELNLFGSNRGEQLGRMATDWRSWASDRSIKELPIVRRGKFDATNVIGKLSDAHFLPFNIAERMARLLPFVDVFIESRAKGMDRQTAINRAFGFTNSTQMIFNRASKAQVLSHPIGAMFANLGTWALNWSGRVLNLPAPEMLALATKSWAYLLIGQTLGLQLEDVLGGQLSDVPVVGDRLVARATGIGTKTPDDPIGIAPKGLLHEAGFSDVFLPIPVFLHAGPAADAMMTAIEGATEWAMGNESLGAAKMSRALTQVKPWQAGWIRELQRFMWGADYPQMLGAEPYQHGIAPHPVTGEGGATLPDDPGFVTWAVQQLPWRSKVRGWEITMQAIMADAQAERVRRERNMLGDEIGATWQRMKLATGVGDHVEAAARRKQLDEQVGEFRSITRSLKGREPTAAEMRSILRRSVASATLPAELRAMLGTFSRTDEDQEGFIRAITRRLSDTSLPFREEWLRAAIEGRWENGAAGFANFLVKLKDRRPVVFDAFKMALDKRKAMWSR